MAFRLMRYAIAAMQRHLDAGHKKLPLVIPVLFYTGRRSPYPFSTNWLQEFDDPGLAGNLYGKAFQLVDVTVIPDDDIMNHRSMAALTLLQKHIHRRDLSDLLDRLSTALLGSNLTGQQLVSLINYLVQAGETDDAEAFVRNLAQKVPQHGNELMTIANQLEQKGIEKGIEKGMQLGEQKGKQDVARNLLKAGMPLHSVKDLTGLSDDELEQICH